MDKQTSLIAINKWMYFIFNYDPYFIDKVWGERKPYTLSDHLWNKFEYLYEKRGCYGVIPAFYGELDWENRIKLMEWVMDNYKDEQKLPQSYLMGE